MRLIMAKVLWNFDMALDEEAHAADLARGGDGVGEWQERQRVFLIWEKRPLMVRLKPRW